MWDDGESEDRSAKALSTPVTVAISGIEHLGNLIAYSVTTASALKYDAHICFDIK
jgi:hypothetical protein